jgi:hypothetical protein
VYRTWDRFDLANQSTITRIVARLYLTPPNLTNQIEFSVWNEPRTTMLYAKSFAQSDLSVSDLGGLNPNFDVTADLPNWDLAAGTYSLSIYHSHPGEHLSWWNSPSTIHGRSVETFDAAGTMVLGFGANGLDLAFRIVGNVIPEPSAAATATVGLICAFGLRRRS